MVEEVVVVLDILDHVISLNLPKSLHLFTFVGIFSSKVAFSHFKEVCLGRKSYEYGKFMKEEINEVIGCMIINSNIK